MKDEVETSARFNYTELLDRTDWKTKLAINVGLAIPGIVLVFLATNPLLQLAGGAWAALNLLPVLQWVVGV